MPALGLWMRRYDGDAGKRYSWVREEKGAKRETPRDFVLKAYSAFLGSSQEIPLRELKRICWAYNERESLSRWLLFFLAFYKIAPSDAHSKTAGTTWNNPSVYRLVFHHSD